MDYNCLRSHVHRASRCVVQALILVVLLVPVNAEPSDVYSVSPDIEVAEVMDEPVGEGSGPVEPEPVPELEPEPLADPEQLLPDSELGPELEPELVSGSSPVYVISPEVDISDFLEAGPAVYDVYSVESPGVAVPYAAGDDFPFYGSSWVLGSVSGLGEVRLFFPINRKELVGLDSSGRIFNVSDNSWSGVMYDASGTSYTVSFGSFALPRYRLYSGSSYQYETLYLTPSESNLVLPDGPSPVYSLSDLLPWVSLLFMGGLLLCCMRKS